MSQMSPDVNSSVVSLHEFHRCYDSKAGSLMSAVFYMFHIFLLLPLSLFILYLALQRWRQRRSFATVRHSDFFTYNWAAMELIMGLGVAFYACGRFFDVTELMTLGFYLISNFYFGPISFHVLTCVERYLAIVHPVTYLGLRQSGGLKIRNASIGFAWFLYIAWFGFQALYLPDVPYVPFFSFLVISLVVVSFCSISVLCIVIRPGPGEMGGTRKRVDQSKQKAFQTITAITAMLWLLFLGLIFCVAIDTMNILSTDDGCAVLVSTTWFTLPGSIVLPALFLQRAGKLGSCHCSNS